MPDDEDMPDGQLDGNQPANNIAPDDDLPDGEADYRAKQATAPLAPPAEESEEDVSSYVTVVTATKPLSSFIDQLRANIESYVKEKTDSGLDKLLSDTQALVGTPATTAAPTSLTEPVLGRGTGFSLPSFSLPNIEADAAYQSITYVSKEKTTPVNPLESIKLPKLIRYAEGEDGAFPTFLLDQLVYIQGVEISKYIKGSISISKNNVTGHNTLTFTLDNANDKFVWTDRNLSGPVFGRSHYLDADGRRQAYPLGPRPDLASGVLAPAFLPFAFLPFEETKRKVFDYKKNGVDADGKPVNPAAVDELGNVLFPRFDLVPNKPIFNRMDPIRVFCLYPFRPRSNAAKSSSLPSGFPLSLPESKEEVVELWMPEFAGFVETVSVEDDNVTGASTITIECSDIRQSVIGKMRISNSVSSSLTNPLDVIGFRPLSYYNGQTLVSSAPGNVAYNKQIQDALLGGTEDKRFFSPTRGNVTFYDDVVNSPYDSAGVIDANMNLEQTLKSLLVFKRDALVQGRSRRGVNNIEFGGTFRFFNDVLPSAKLRAFLQDYHRFTLFGPKRRPWTREEVEEVGSETKTTGKFSPLNCRLWVLLPDTDTGPSNLADLASVNIQLTHQANWTTRLEVIRNVVESLDYQMYVSGTGDIHVEFPFADFRPEDFGEFKDVFRFDKATITTSYSDEAEEPTSGIIVITGFGAAAGTAPEPGEAILQSIFAFSPYIAGRYGINVAQPIPLPFLNYKQKGIAQQRAAIEMQKANARTHSLSMQTAYRPFLLPNRPVHVLRRSRMGTVVTVETSWEIGAQPKASVSMGLEHIRTWTGGYISEQKAPPSGSVQAEDLEATGTKPAQFDSVTPPADLIEDQVFTTVMGGGNLPTTTRSIWSVESPLASLGGVYLLDLQKLRKEELEAALANAREADASRPAEAAPSSSETTGPSNRNLGLDYSASRINATAIKETGAKFVGRYLDTNADPSTEPKRTKFLSLTEKNSLLENGINIALIFQRFGDEFLGNNLGGLFDPKDDPPPSARDIGVILGRRALASAQLLGIPDNVYIYFSLEESNGITTDQEKLQKAVEFVKGAASAVGQGRAGVYGGLKILEAVQAANAAVAFWQAADNTSERNGDGSPVRLGGVSILQWNRGSYKDDLKNVDNLGEQNPRVQGTDVDINEAFAEAGFLMGQAT